ncbi:MAG: hypothetical protein CMC86_05020 [Flavobacteriaceae bacterium]|nr:hypothetical protein [Flavobacteriaceae bacterium]|tara:strand:+ start:41254 stop:42198 length:945 start_codon:yes stop_codon:yes gene_type:complete
MKKFIFNILFLFTLSIEVYAQSGIKLTDYFFNPIQYNPAYVGANNGYFTKGTYTSQWLGFDDGPVTQTLDIQKRFPNNRYAAGISLLNDDFGAVKNFNFETNFALHLKASEDIGFVLGLKAGLNNFSIDYNRLNIYNPNEYVYSQGNLSNTAPIIGAGFYLYTKKWFISMSIPNFLKYRMEDDFNQSLYNKVPHFYTSAGYDYYINSELILKSQVLMQLVRGAPVSYLLSSRVLYKQKLGFGIHLQPKALYGIFANFRFNSSFTATYGYDMALSDLSRYSSGNHFFGLSYKFGKDKKDCCAEDIIISDRVYMIR